MRNILLLVLLVGGPSLPPLLLPAQSGGTEANGVGQTSHSGPYDPAASPEPSTTAHPVVSTTRGIGVGFRVSSLGLGGELAVELTQRSNLRGGFNAFSYDRRFSRDGINYAGHLTLQSAEVHYDWFPFGGFHLSPGAMVYDRNKGTAPVSVGGGNAFTLDGGSYISAPGNPVTGNARVVFNRVAPTFMVGSGNLVRRAGRRFSVSVEAGVAYHGTPRATLNLGGGVCSPLGIGCETIASDPGAEGDVAAEQARINHDISAFKVYPVISLEFGYRIR